MKPTISVIIPALNEENNINPTIEEVLSAIGDKFSNYEIFIFDDGSSDRTGIIADELAIKNSNIKVIHNKSNMGLGYNYREGIKLAKNDYIVWFPGDNDVPRESMEKIFKEIGKADIVIPYPTNSEVRPLLRRIISKVFVLGMNILFGLKLKYYNGTVMYKKDIVKSTSVSIATNSFAFQSGLLVKLLKAGYSYLEIGYKVEGRDHAASKALCLKNIINVIKTIVNIFGECYICSPKDKKINLRKERERYLIKE